MRTSNRHGPATAYNKTGSEVVDDVRRTLERNVGDAASAQHHSFPQLLLRATKR